MGAFAFDTKINRKRVQSTSENARAENSYANKRLYFFLSSSENALMAL